jgi:large subunit ribosomal protein L44e
VKIPNKITKFCKTCRVHTLHSSSKYKPKKPSQLSWIVRQKNRRHSQGNKGKFSKPPAKRFKNSKKLMLILKCTVCSSSRSMVRPRCIKSQIKKV